MDLARDTLEHYRRIRIEARREALEEAAKAAEDYDGDGMRSQGHDAQLGDAFLTRREIAAAIRALAPSGD